MRNASGNDKPVITTVGGRRVRWLGNFANTSPDLYRRSPGSCTNIVGPPYPCGKFSVAELEARGLRGAYEPA